MITLGKARDLVSSTSRLIHSFTVSSLMGRLAQLLDADVEMWMLVGALHDLDYDETHDDRTQHGVVAAQRLAEVLPDEALRAILCHDHRAGFSPESDLDYGLILCDSVALVIEETGIDLPVSYPDFIESLDQIVSQKSWLPRLIYNNPLLGRVDLSLLLDAE